MKKNSLFNRARKAVVALAVALVEIANVWIGGPQWLYAVAPVVATVLVYSVGNAPEYSDPRKR